MTTSRPDPASLGDAAAGDGDRIGRLGEDRHLDLATERAELIDGRGALQVGSDENRVATLGLEPASQLRRRGRLARALKSCQQHHGRRLRRVRDAEGLAAERGDELLVDDLDDLLCRREALREVGAQALLADARDDAANDREVDVGLEKGHADLAQHLVDVAVAESPLAPEPFEDAVETVGEGIEHAVSQATGAVRSPARFRPRRR